MLIHGSNKISSKTCKLYTFYRRKVKKLVIISTKIFLPLRRLSGRHNFYMLGLGNRSPDVGSQGRPHNPHSASHGRGVTRKSTKGHSHTINSTHTK